MSVLLQIRGQEALFPCSAVLFDMDGVLLDTEVLYTRAYNEVLASWSAHLDRQTKLEIMGGRAIDSARHVVKKKNLAISAEELLARRTPILEQLFATCQAMPGAQRFVERLRATGVPMAVATSSGRRLFELKTQQHAWFENFNAIVCGDDPEVQNGKPAPDIFLTAAQRLETPPECCAVFEDSPKGCQAALTAGSKTFALVPVKDERSRYPAKSHFISDWQEVEVEDSRSVPSGNAP